MANGKTLSINPAAYGSEVAPGVRLKIAGDRVTVTVIGHKASVVGVGEVGWREGTCVTLQLDTATT